MTRRPALALLAALALPLAACSSEPESPEVNETNLTLPEDESVAPLANLADEPIVNATPSPQPTEAVPDEAQMLDDADATGMTARVDRGETGSDNEAVPTRE